MRLLSCQRVMTMSDPYPQLIHRRTALSQWVNRHLRSAMYKPCFSKQGFLLAPKKMPPGRKAFLLLHQLKAN